MCITCEGFCMGTGCQILVLIAKPNFVLILIQFCFAKCITGSEWGWQRGWQQLCWAELLGWREPPETPRVKGGQLGQVLTPVTTASPPLHSPHQHFLICFGQTQLDYLEPLLKIILLALGVSLSFLMGTSEE